MGMRSQRFGLRPVNPDPRPPNEPRHQPVKGPNSPGSNQYSNGVATYSNQNPYGHNTHYTGGANNPNHNGNGGVKQPPVTGPPSPGQQASNGLNPKNLFEFSKFSPHGADPRDATYWDNVNKLLFQGNQDYAQSNFDQSQSDLGYNRNMRDLATQRAGQERSITEGAIGSGLAHSGYLDRTQTDATRGYLTTLGDQQIDKQTEDQQRELGRASILQGFTVNESGELSDAAGRLSDAQAEAAAKDPGQFTLKDLQRAALHQQLTKQKRIRSNASGAEKKAAIKKIRSIRNHLGH